MRQRGQHPGISVVHDYATQRGGAERVALLLAQRFGGGRLNVLVAARDQSFEDYDAIELRSSWLSRVRLFREDPRRALPLLPFVVLGLRLPSAAVTLCSSSGWAHGVRSRGPKIVYCHNVARWLYQPAAYSMGLPGWQRLAGAAIRLPLLAWDQWRARSVDTYIANSRVVADRVTAAYGRTAIVINPPVTLGAGGPREPLGDLAPGFFLTVSRARGYKRTEQIIQAFETLPETRLVVVGDSPHNGSPPNIRHVGGVSDAQLRWLYANCRALIAVSDEDFGLTPVECFTFGRPVVALRAGGYLETVFDGVSGVFIDAPDPASIREGLRRLDAVTWSEETIRQHAAAWGVDAFVARVGEVLERHGVGALRS